MHKIILARHAETIWNEQLRYIGRTDLDLSPLGQSNAELLATYLECEDIAMIVASGRRRARQTADFIARKHHLKTFSESLLNEIDFGDWEGLTHREITVTFPKIVAQWLNDPFSVNIPGGEPWPVFAERVWSGWKKIIDKAKGIEGTVLVVTHAGCIKVILGRLLEISGDRWWQIYQDKGALNYLALDGKKTCVVKVNDTDYRRQASPSDSAE